jgi:catechol 2,3-dioxygenase-like lactoylglutathione lyase family enzyme
MVHMRDHIIVLTLGVDDLERSLKFYRDGLELPSRGILGTEFEHGTVAMFDLQDNLKLALFPRADLALDARLRLSTASPTEFSIGHVVASKAEVDAIMQQAEKAGATITDHAHERPWGVYSGYFQDPDGHLWEVAWDADL